MNERSKPYQASLFGIAVLFASACDSGGPPDAGTRSNGDVGTVACDPLASQAAQTVMLGDILGVGRDDNGTLYVVDSTTSGGDPRVFVGQPGMLVRKRVTGSGESDQGGVRFVTLSLDEQPTLTLALEISPSGIRMATAASVVKAPSFDALPNRHDLTTLDSSGLTDKSALDLPLETVIEYLAKAETGELLLVTSPRNGGSYTDFRAFYGAPPKLSERPVDSVTRAKDGGTTFVKFGLNGSVATAYFPVMLDPQSGAILPGPATLELKGKTTNLALLDSEPASLGGAKLFCFP